jgi:VCBS repeat-containing protein
MNAKRWRRTLVALVATVAFAHQATGTAGAVAAEGQYEGPSYAGSASSPTGSKPQSKLWFNDGTWWSAMNVADPGSDVGPRIFKLDLDTQQWADTGVQIDARNNVRSDVLWDGTKLYVATHRFSESPASGTPSNLYRFSYNSSTDTYSLDSGFPVQINNWRTETLVLAKDSTGQLWATWTQQSQVFVNRTTGSDTAWGAPFALPGGTGLDADDISSVVAFGGNRIGIMWSDQSADQMKFAVHQDSTSSDTSWSSPEVVVSGSNMADDHINLQADATGRVYAATKTSASSGSNPLILLNVRNATGAWSTVVFGTVQDNQTRPIIVLHEARRRLYMFATWDQSGDRIYVKETSMDAPSFPSGRGDVVIDAADVNNATSTKQSITDASGLLVQASADATDLHWHYWKPFEVTTPVNTPPVALPDSASTNEDQAVTVAAPGVLANDTDLDGDALTASLVTGPTHGTLSLNTNGRFTYTPAANYNGPDAFTYRASDGTASSLPATVTLTVNAVNDAPVADAGNDQTVEHEADFTLSGAGTDVDGEALTYEWTQIEGPVAVIRDPDEDETVVEGVEGPATLVFRLTVTDPSGASSTDDVTVTVNPK